MIDGRRRLLWGAVSSLMAQTAEINRNPKRRSKPYRPSDFDPTIPQRPKPKITVAQLATILKRNATP